MRIASRMRSERQSIGVRRVFRLLEADRDVRLGGKVVDFVGLYLLNDADQARRIGHVAVMQDEVALGDMRILVQVVDAVRVEQRRTALDAVNDRSPS
jgi:hypothetical protein